MDNRCYSAGGSSNHGLKEVGSLRRRPRKQVVRKRESVQKQHHGTSRTASSLCCPGVIRTYALQELKTATADFKFRIGVGATSFVYLAELGDGRFGAVKRVMEERGGSRKMFLDEVSVLLRISHPNLVGLLGFCLDKGKPKQRTTSCSAYFHF